MRTRDGSDDFRLRAVESSLETLEAELKDLKSRQGHDDAAIGQMQKHLGELVTALKSKGLAPSASAAPQGSALGVGFAHPAAAAGPDTPPAQPAQASPGRAPGAVPAAGIEEGHGIPMPTAEGAKIAAEAPAPPASGRQAAMAAPDTARGRRGLGRLGPAEPPATPEAAIAADRAGQPAKPAAAPTAGSMPVAPGAAAPSTAASAGPTPAGTEPPTGPAASPTTAAATPGTPEAPPVRDNRPGSPAESASPAEKSEYNRALQLAINGNAAAAKAAFDQFVATHPASPLAPSALYWVGESAYAAGDYTAAVTDFDKVAKGWPGHSKAADALYKMAMAQEKSGDVAAARATLERYLKDYPEAELASVVRQKLQSLPK
ncbi:MAG: tol-pal system protein YbgF [Solidesulfovibrio sp. DCME]|uniref:tol-pal system protein YbgF n=1 Tax=Solidesulfovibrio sp. DCME TaxID=3447380 RepID=UPI003D0A6B59